MSNVHTIQETKQRERKEGIIAAEKVAVEIVDTISDYNLSSNTNAITNLDSEHRNNLTKINQIVSKQPLLVQSEIAKKSSANEYLVTQLLDQKILENTELTNENKILTQENNMIKSRLQESDSVYDATAINKVRQETYRELEQMKIDLGNSRRKKREIGQAMLLAHLSTRK